MNAVMIPARRGSVGVKNKNITMFAGMPLIYWTIKHALMSGCVDEVWVSSDSDEILALSKSYGANVLKRPDGISGSSSVIEDAIVHFLYNVDYVSTVALLQTTSPLRMKNDTDNAILLQSIHSSGMLSTPKTVIGVTSDSNSRLWSSCGKALLQESSIRKPRQLRKQRFVENGSIYVFDAKRFMRTGKICSNNVCFYGMNDWQKHEIDTYEDIIVCESLMKGMGLCETYLVE
jgi:N-acylneuraminate cytidylyltransferase